MKIAFVSALLLEAEERSEKVLTFIWNDGILTFVSRMAQIRE